MINQFIEVVFYNLNLLNLNFIMKRLPLIMTIAICSIMLTFSCNSADSSTEATDSSADTITNETVSNADEIKSKVDETVSNGDENLEAKDFSEIGDYLMSNEKFDDLALQLSVDKVIKKYSTPDEKTEPKLWGADGFYHQTLKYNTLGFELGLSGEVATKMTIDRITINAPCSFKTNEGVGIGSSKADVEKAYKNQIDPSIESSEVILAGTIYGGLTFDIKDGKVASIFLGAGAE